MNGAELSHWIKKRSEELGFSACGIAPARFYKSFGATQITYPHLYLNKLNPLFRFGLSVIKKLKN
jgi:hypothetical protein